jgi:phosphoglycerate kinase
VGYVVQRRAAVVLMSHLGRPKGQVVEELRIRPVAERMSELLGKRVHPLDVTIGPQAEAATRQLEGGEVLLLENTRFLPGETSNDEETARHMARLGDLFVNDAFGTAHRAHASTVGVARFLAGCIGFLTQRELEMLGQVRDHARAPYVAILGGAKVSDKLSLVSRLLEQVDSLCVGGGIANTFLEAAGHNVGLSLVDREGLTAAREALATHSSVIQMPVDAVIEGPDDASGPQSVSVDSVPSDARIVDIGPRTIAAYTERLSAASTVFWNGPLGIFERPPFDVGTRAMAVCLAGLEDATVVVAGGDSAAAIRQLGLDQRVSWVSTGGGAALQFMAGQPLPALRALIPSGEKAS